MRDIPAFPTPVPDDVLNKQGNNVTIFAGMTLRDYFAGQALMGMLAMQPKEDGGFDSFDVATKHFADASYEYADAMLKAREKNGE